MRNDATDVPVQASDCRDSANPNVLIDPDRAQRAVRPLTRGRALTIVNVPSRSGVEFTVAGPRAAHLIDIYSMKRYT